MFVGRSNGEMERQSVFINQWLWRLLHTDGPSWGFFCVYAPCGLNYGNASWEITIGAT